MPFVDCSHLRHLTPQAFKLYTCLLDLADRKDASTLTISLANLGWEWGLHPAAHTLGCDTATMAHSDGHSRSCKRRAWSKNMAPGDELPIPTISVPAPTPHRQPDSFTKEHPMPP